MYRNLKHKEPESPLLPMEKSKENEDEKLKESKHKICKIEIDEARKYVKYVM